MQEEILIYHLEAKRSNTFSIQNLYFKLKFKMFAHIYENSVEGLEIDWQCCTVYLQSVNIPHEPPRLLVV